MIIFNCTASFNSIFLTSTINDLIPALVISLHKFLEIYEHLG